MKRSFLIMTAMLLVFSLTAEEKKNEYRQLIGQNRNISHGGYGALSLSYGKLDGKDALQAGARIGWIIDHRFAIGFAGKGFVNDMYLPGTDEISRRNLAGGYGGLFFEPIIAPFAPVHFAFPVMVGAGGIAHVNYSNWYFDDYADPEVYDADVFFVLEPGIEVEANILRFMRVALGVSYRYTSRVRLPQTQGNVLHGLNGGITLKFGKF